MTSSTPGDVRSGASTFPAAPPRTCACGHVSDLAAAAYCSSCGRRLPALQLPEPDQVPDPRGYRRHLGERYERILHRALRDVADGHIGLRGRPGAVSIDRIVSVHLSRGGRDWVDVLLHRGWIAQVDASSTLDVTAAGRAALSYGTRAALDQWGSQTAEALGQDTTPTSQD